MKLAIFAYSLDAGGAERVALNLASAFLAAGHHVDLVLVTAKGDLLAQVPDAIQIVDLKASRVRSSIWAFRHYLGKHRPDAVLAINFDVNLAASIAMIGMKRRPLLILSVHMPPAGWLASTSPLRRLLKSRISKLLYRKADRVVAVSEGIGRELVRSRWTREAQTRVIHNPVLSSRLDALASEPANHPWLLDPSIPCIVTLGRLTPLKNQALLIEAFERLVRDRVARLLIVGEGECREALELQIAEAGLAGAVDLTGFVANPYPILKAADLFVLSSDWEGFGNVLVEAMALGTPVVATDCPYGPSEILEGGKWGRLVPCRNAEALSSAIREALDRPGPDGARRALQFTILGKAADYLELIETGLGSVAR